MEVAPTSAPNPVLFVDDEPEILETFRLAYEDDFRVLTAPSGSAAMRILDREAVAVLVTDQRMPEMPGLELIRRAREKHADLLPIILTGFTDVEALVDAINLRGIYRFMAKPWDTRELRLTIQRALGEYQLKEENRRLLEELRRLNEHLEAENSYLRAAVSPGHLVGGSPAMQRLREKIGKAARSAAPVLIEGETGTGKELVAHAIHAGSARRDRLFVPLNCSAVPESMLESELLGHRRGAFTGAVTDKKGLFEVAEGGTLFLDEVAELPLNLQVKLLRVLQEGEVRPLGDTKTRRVDVRVIAATNRRLEEEIKEGRLREDFYYRLKVYPVHVPPLRERLDDVPPLVDHFLVKYCRTERRPLVSVTPDAMRMLVALEYAGNVRELEHLIWRGLLEAEPGEAITEIDLGLAEPVDVLPLQDEHLRVDREALQQALARAEGNKTHAARSLGMTYRGFLKKGQRLGLFSRRDTQEETTPPADPRPLNDRS